MVWKHLGCLLIGCFHPVMLNVNGLSVLASDVECSDGKDKTGVRQRTDMES